MLRGPLPGALRLESADYELLEYRWAWAWKGFPQAQPGPPLLPDGSARWAEREHRQSRWIEPWLRDGGGCPGEPYRCRSQNLRPLRARPWSRRCRYHSLVRRADRNYPKPQC